MNSPVLLLYDYISCLFAFSGGFADFGNFGGGGGGGFPPAGSQPTPFAQMGNSKYNLDNQMCKNAMHKFETMIYVNSIF